jgi:pimeloyl-ACP methyl ester carboxylesterase
MTAKLILVHGAQSDQRAWNVPLRWLADHGYEAVALDLPGHGDNRGSPLKDIEGMGQWLGGQLCQIETNDPFAATKSHRAPSSFVLVGHSMGSLAALECAAAHCGKVAALVLVGTAYPMRVSAGLLDLTRTNEAGAIAQVAQWSYAKAGDSVSDSTRSLRSERIAQAEQLMRSQQAGLLQIDMNACNSYRNGLIAASRVTCPSLIIAGSEDKMTAPKFALGLQQTLNADFRTIDGAGHSIMDECGDTLCELIDQFLSLRGLGPKIAPSGSSEAP